MAKDILKTKIKKQGKTVWIYTATVASTADDVDEDYGEVDETLLVPIPVKCLVITQSPEKIQWKFQGIKTHEIKILIMPKRYLKTLRLSYKIVINDNEYYGYKDNSNQLQIEEMDDNYLKVSIARVE